MGNVTVKFKQPMYQDGQHYGVGETHEVDTEFAKAAGENYVEVLGEAEKKEDKKADEGSKKEDKTKPEKKEDKKA